VVSGLSLLILTEDSSDEAHGVIIALTEKVLRLVDPAADVRKTRFDPTNEKARRILTGFFGRGEIGHQKLVDIEAWLYQNCEEAARIYREHHKGNTKDPALFDLWKQNPGLLDEIKDIKDAVEIKSRYNLRLSTQGFPAARARSAGKSFAHAVQHFES
jgi:hypothetical protein